MATKARAPMLIPPRPKELTEEWKAAPVPTKRLTLDIPADLHLAIKVAVAQAGSDMVTEITRLLLDKYLPGDQ